MEILNNLWTAISTPNEGLISFLSIPLLLFIETPLTLSLICNLFNIKCSIKNKILYVLLTAFVGIFAIRSIQWPYNIILNYLSAFIIIYFVLKAGFFKTILSSVLPSIVFMLLENLLFNPYLTILDISYADATTIPMYRIPYALFVYLIVFTLIIIFKTYKIQIKNFESFDKKNQTIIILNFIFGLFNIIMQVILTVNYIDILPISFTFFNFICLLIYFSLSFYTLIKVINLVSTTQKLKTVEEYNKELQVLHDSVRGFKHDFDNIVTTIGGYVKTNDMEGLSKYYSQLEGDCTKVSNLYVLNPDIINNPGVYSLLTTKYSEAEEKGIHINLTILLDFNNLNMKIYEFSRILGILLDNAIEAASECDEKILNIDFRNEAKNNRNIILIENTYNNKNVDTQEIFNKGITGKENHSGLGLWEIRQILKKNNNINLHTAKNEKYFSQQLEIYY